MHKIFKILILSLSFFTMQGQSITTILNELNNGQRKDTIISFNNKKELEYIPLTIIKGKNQSPIYTIVAGVHGYEYPPIIAVQELMREIDPDKLHGTLLILPFANTASFYKRSPFLNPIDQKNLNTTFPGSADGTISEKIANWITKEIIPLSDIFLDIHGGDASEDLLPFICYYNNNDEQTAKANVLSEVSGVEYIISYPYNINKTEPAKYAFKQAVQDGKVALSIEAGKLGTTQQESVLLIKNAVYNMLDYLSIYNKKITVDKISTKHLYNQSYIRVSQRGIFHSTVKSGDTIYKDQNLGYTTDDFGTVLQQITAPVNGIVLYKIGTPPVNTGETLFCIGY